MVYAGLISVAFASLWTAQISSAVPMPSPDITRTLSKRSGVVFQDCGDVNDPRLVKAQKAFSEAADLAAFTATGTLDDGTKFQGTDAYTHYFDNTDFVTVTNMFSNIQSGSSGDSGSGSQLTFIVSCQSTDLCQDSFAITDVKPMTDSFTPTIRLCPLFFTSSRTTYFLADKTTKRDPKRKDPSWCQPGQPFSFFETPGHTFLHEMTHLDQLGKVAGLSEEQDGDITTHGTNDVYAIDKSYNIGDPDKASRKLKDSWAFYDFNNKQFPEPPLQRVQNAESYAAAATEFYFQSKCGWPTIQP